MKHFRTMTLSLLLLCACSGSSGTSTPDGQTQGEGGSFTDDDFSYEDPHPPEFHPLGTASALLTSRDELMILDVPEYPGIARATIFDDIGAGAGVLADVANLLSPGQYRAAAAGNLDDDAEEELILSRIVGSTLEFTVIETDAQGVYIAGSSLQIPSAGFPYGEVHLSLGDVDGDHRDELVIVARRKAVGEASDQNWVRVYDDPVDGYGLLHEISWGSLLLAELKDIQAQAADFDGDGRAEVALLAHTDSGLLGNPGAYLRILDDSDAGFDDLVGWFQVGGDLPPERSAVRLLTGEYNGEFGAELAVGTYWDPAFSTYEFSVTFQSYEFGPGAVLHAAPRWEGQGFAGSGALGALRSERGWDVAFCDKDGDGDHEALIALPGALYTRRLVALRWDGAGWVDDGELSVSLGANLNSALTLLTTDDDADGQDEMYYCLISKGSSSSTKFRNVYRVDWGNIAEVVTDHWTSVVPAGNNAYPPVLVAGDFDADGLSVRFSGRKFTSLADPMPMVVLAAAPTKAGIAQNYGDTTTSYEVTAGTSQSFGVSSGTTASTYVGFAIDSLFGILDVSARRRIEESFATSLLETNSFSTIQGFAGPYSDDTIVFQGTLYQSYEYEILASTDPQMVGTYFTLNVPVESRVYKWTVDYYNSKVEPEARIGSDVLTHTVGDPTSYPSKTAVQLLTELYVGWWTPTGLTVGQGNATNAVGIQLEQESTSEQQRTFDVTWEADFSVGSLEFGGSLGVTETEIYSVTVSEQTIYRGDIGDIAGPSEYESWEYGFGMGVYHHGLLSNANNQPTATVAGVVPYQVVTYWTDPTGSSY